MKEELEPLSDDLFKALEAERARPPAPADQLARLAGRIDSTFAALPAAAPAAVAAGAGTKVAILVAGLALGAIGGAQLQQRFGAPREVIVERVVEVPVWVEVPVRVEVPVAAPQVALPPVPAPPSPRGVEAPRPMEQRRKEGQGQPPRAPIELERLLIEQATSALGRGQGADALAACVEHAKRFPSGQLVEERESLAIRALVSLNRKPEAVARAAAFRAAFPDSLLLDVVEEAVR